MKFTVCNCQVYHGSFEVLNKHAPLISALKSGRIKVLNDKTHTTFFEIRSGFVEVMANRVTVLVEGAKLWSC